jgi:fructokinase
VANLLGGIEAGGTKFVCLIGTGPEDIVAETRIPTLAPPATIQRAIAFFTEHITSLGRLAGLGIASFGPLELRPASPSYGFITTTPKPNWSEVDLVGPFRAALGVPVGLDTDVNGAALGEGRWGAARGLGTFVYMTVGTGIGAGAVVNGAVARGLVHPEMGHMIVPRHPRDHYPGHCPFHADCLEAMAGGPALAARWGHPPEELAGEDLAAAVALEAYYLAAGLRNIVYTLAPERIVLGGGVAGLPGLFPKLRTELERMLGGYPGLAEHSAEDFVTPAALGRTAGPAGALVLAELAAASEALSRGRPAE